MTTAAVTDEVFFNPETGLMEVSGGRPPSMRPTPQLPQSSVPVQRIPASPDEKTAFDLFQFANLRPRMISKESKLTFADINSMHLVRIAPATFRRNGTPEWVRDNKMALQQCVVGYMERRFHLHPSPDEDLSTRLRKAEDKCRSYMEQKARLLDHFIEVHSLIERFSELIEQYCSDQTGDSVAKGESKSIVRQIQILDSDIVLMKKGIPNCGCDPIQILQSRPKQRGCRGGVVHESPGSTADVGSFSANL